MARRGLLFLLAALAPDRPARIPRPLRRHPPQQLRPPRRLGADRRRDPRRRRPRPPARRGLRCLLARGRPGDAELPAHRRRLPRRPLPDRAPRRRPLRHRRAQRSLASGASLLGLPHHWVSLGFLSNTEAVRAIWNTQFALILGAHVLAVLLSLRLAGPRPAIAHLPMTVLMVLYTILGLWLLATPTAG